MRRASCLVNPKACHETEFPDTPVSGTGKNVAVVGAGPAGLSFATHAASRGHSVTLFDSATEIGGQFNLAKLVPGKEEFSETLRYSRAVGAAVFVPLLWWFGLFLSLFPFFPRLVNVWCKRIAPPHRCMATGTFPNNWS